MFPNYTQVRLTQDVPCTSGKLGDEGTVLDKLESGDNKQFYIVELPTKQDIVTVPEEWIVNVDLN